MNKHVLPHPVWKRVEQRRRQHEHLAKEQVDVFCDKLSIPFDQEIDILANKFSRTGSLSPILAPVADSIRDYLLWLRWAPWLTTRLAPSTGLDREADARRLALGTLAYLGARFMDDGIDNHTTYKQKRETLVGALLRMHPQLPRSFICSQSTLIGFWIVMSCVKRMDRLGWSSCARHVNRLYEIIIPGVVAESLLQNDGNLTQYQEIITRKSVSYDMIIYQCFLDPLPGRLKEPVLDILAKTSRIAQNLNDYMDRHDDRKRNQMNLCLMRFDRESDFWKHCMQETHACLLLIDKLPANVGNALCAIMVEVFEASLCLWGDNPKTQKDTA